jgi:hypothetical protein
MAIRGEMEMEMEMEIKGLERAKLGGTRFEAR